MELMQASARHSCYRRARQHDDDDDDDDSGSNLSCAPFTTIVFLQGQLALLHNLFKAALYDEDLIRVRNISLHPTVMSCSGFTLVVLP